MTPGAKLALTLGGIGAAWLFGRRAEAAAPEAYSEATSARRGRVTVTPTIQASGTTRADPMVQLGQRYLDALGYDVGPIDGRMGPLTRNALHDWQLNNDLPQTNTFTTATLEQLSRQMARIEGGSGASETSGFARGGWARY
jgi:peptidoglycan hydrolase-like protein with peptidoglycan-binding domain